MLLRPTTLKHFSESLELETLQQQQSCTDLCDILCPSRQTHLAKNNVYLLAMNILLVVVAADRLLHTISVSSMSSNIQASGQDTPRDRGQHCSEQLELASVVQTLAASSGFVWLLERQRMMTSLAVSRVSRHLSVCDGKKKPRRVYGFCFTLSQQIRISLLFLTITIEDGKWSFCV